jgi:hypothetical protein
MIVQNALDGDLVHVKNSSARVEEKPCYCGCNLVSPHESISWKHMMSNQDLFLTCECLNFQGSSRALERSFSDIWHKKRALIELNKFWITKLSINLDYCCIYIYTKYAVQNYQMSTLLSYFLSVSVIYIYTQQ